MQLKHNNNCIEITPKQQNLQMVKKNKKPNH